MGDCKYAGTWDAVERKLHINVLELRAVRIVLTLHNPPVNSVILATTDNATVVAYINHQGGTRSWDLWQETQTLLRLALKHNWTVRSRHIAGNLNVLADRLSRDGQILPSEWELHQEAAQLLFDRWDPPHVDLFATRENSKCPLFVSPFPMETALGVDAFSLSWEGWTAYAYPPTKIITKVLNKVEETKSLRLILVTPLWQKQLWFPRLLQLSQEPPFPLPHWERLLKQPQGNLFHSCPSWLNLHGWLVLRPPIETEVSGRKRPNAWQLPKPNPL